MKFRFAHESIEINAGLLIALTMVVISIGGLVEIVPLFYIDETIEKEAMGMIPMRRMPPRPAIMPPPARQSCPRNGR